MVVVPAGEFMMGLPTNEEGRTNTENPQHKVTIAAPFAVSEFEVTFDEWDTCATYGDCDPQILDNDFGRGRQPVINVSWYDAKRYAAWLSKMTGKSYRLLSEAEWEYAARAGTKMSYSWGDEIGKRKANCLGCGSEWDGERTAPVGSFAANAFGLHDMHGNVSEWVEDCYHANYDGAPADGLAWTAGGDCSSRMFRGGGWNDSPVKHPLRQPGQGRDLHPVQQPGVPGRSDAYPLTSLARAKRRARLPYTSPRSARPAYSVNTPPHAQQAGAFDRTWSRPKWARTRSGTQAAVVARARSTCSSASLMVPEPEQQPGH